jgi:hypothetical protein
MESKMNGNQDRKKILQMLAKGTISVEEADQLLGAVGVARTGGAESIASGQGSAMPNYLHVQVEPKAGQHGDRVNVRVPFQLIRAGAKLAGLIPKVAREKINDSLSSHGINFDVGAITSENIETLVDQLGDLTVDVDNETEKITVYCS